MSVSQNVTRANGNFARGRFSVPRACDGTQRGTSARCTAWKWSPDRTYAASCIVLLDGDTSGAGQPPRRRDGGRFLTTVLITDIVDSTGMAMRLGDQRWRDVLVDHYTACRSHVERNRGELVNTTGDGVVANARQPRPCDLRGNRDSGRGARVGRGGASRCARRRM